MLSLLQCSSGFHSFFSYNNLDDPGRCDAYWSKSDRGRQTPHVITYTWDLKRIQIMNISKQEQAQRCREVQSLSRVWLFATPWTAACQASLSITNPWSLLKLMSIESVMISNHLNLCRPLLFPPSIFPSIRVFSNETALRIRWPKYWGFSFSIYPSKEYSGFISFRIDWLDLLAVQGTLKSLLQHRSSKLSVLKYSAFFMVQLLTSVHDYWKNHSSDYMDLCRQSNVSVF